ncbi:MAG TPA: YkgJ family cysteine cluster protein [Candidatus Omnitrophota bacterium]|nr:YkgJ family cysteine cluster protein [Candidatus Omnitrophota bacterium]HPD84485.1 YkgJ family cysteine cluster protein [Candidatus Omnitrophota bacterium]HRZ03343.1 YkgJ family cysteine cluster protein [Candidatus Omnitrophota bacterium]
MINNIKQFLSSEICLSCDGCCRFQESDSSWRPKITADDITQTGKSKSPSAVYPKNAIAVDGRLKTVLDKAHTCYLCCFFMPETNACRIYEFRPFECRLYPFLLTKKDGKDMIAVHLYCPFVRKTKDSPEFNRYVGYLKDLFSRKEVIVFIKKNPSLIGNESNYQDELEHLFTIG